jgi:hypothetical protein
MLIKNERSVNTMPPLRDRNNNFNLSYDCFEKAGILNRHFCSVSDLNDRNKDLPPFEVRCKNVLSQIIVSEQDILDMISTLDANKAVGPNIISNKMLIAVKVRISKPLCMLFNKSLHQNIFPLDWKLAHVIPLFKAGDKSFPSNYRPVSLFSCVSKLLEKIVFKHIFNHLQGNKLLCISKLSPIPYLSNLSKSPFIHTVSKALLISANVTLVNCLLSKASKIL